MPYMPIEVKGKRLILTDDMRTVLGIFEKVMGDSVELLEQALKPTYVEPTGVFTKVGSWAGLTFKPKKAHFGAFTVSLDPKAYAVCQAYVDEVLNRTLLKQGISPEKMESPEISDRFVLIREILLRVVLVTMSTESQENPQVDPQKQLLALTSLISALNGDSVTHNRKWLGLRTEWSLLNWMFEGEQQKEFGKLFVNVLESVRALHLNTRAVNLCLKSLSEIEFSIKAHMVCRMQLYLGKSTSLADLEKTQINTTFWAVSEEYEKQRTLREGKKITSGEFELYEPSITTLKELLEDTRKLTTMIEKVDEVNKAFGWSIWFNRIINADAINEALTAHHNKCQAEIDIATHREMYSPSAPKALGAANATNLTSKAVDLVESAGRSLMEMQSSTLIDRLAEDISDAFNALMRLGQEMGVDIIDPTRISTLPRVLVERCQVDLSKAGKIETTDESLIASIVTTTIKKASIEMLQTQEVDQVRVYKEPSLTGVRDVTDEFMADLKTHLTRALKVRRRVDIREQQQAFFVRNLAHELQECFTTKRGYDRHLFVSRGFNFSTVRRIVDTALLDIAGNNQSTYFCEQKKREVPNKRVAYLDGETHAFESVKFDMTRPGSNVLELPDSSSDIYKLALEILAYTKEEHHDAACEFFGNEILGKIWGHDAGLPLFTTVCPEFTMLYGAYRDFVHPKGEGDDLEPTEELQILKAQAWADLKELCNQPAMCKAYVKHELQPNIASLAAIKLWARVNNVHLRIFKDHDRKDEMVVEEEFVNDSRGSKVFNIYRQSQGRLIQLTPVANDLALMSSPLSDGFSLSPSSPNGGGLRRASSLKDSAARRLLGGSKASPPGNGSSVLRRHSSREEEDLRPSSARKLSSAEQFLQECDQHDAGLQGHNRHSTWSGAEISEGLAALQSEETHRDGVVRRISGGGASS